MDKEMIERVSKAILETPNASDYPVLVARNAIKVMREPTKQMVDTFSSYDIDGYQGFIDAIIGDK
jgi:hypothetical protein